MLLYEADCLFMKLPPGRDPATSRHVHQYVPLMDDGLAVPECAAAQGGLDVHAPLGSPMIPSHYRGGFPCQRVPVSYLPSWAQPSS